MLAAVLAGALALCAAGAYLMKRDAGRNTPGARGEGERADRRGGEDVVGGFKGGNTGSARARLAYCGAMTAACLGASVALALVYPGNTFIFNMRRISLLSLLLPAAYIDFKTCRIPNAFIGAGTAYWAALLIAEFFAAGAEASARTAVSGLVAAGALAAAAFLCAAAIRGSVGAGDIKLFMVMGLLLGLEGIWGAVLLSLAASFAASVYLLATKRKTRKDTLPFAPALAVGAFLSVMLTGM
jgi:leader peptidase (prepilin peptidase)/N-methyltransferase